MRYKWNFLLVMILTLESLSLNAQSSLPRMPGSFSPIHTLHFPDYQLIRENRFTQQKWFVSRYGAVSAGSIYYPGANAFVISAPVGLQLNRQLTNNWYAFAGVYAAPTWTSFNHSFLNSPNNPSYPGAMSNANLFGVNPGIQMGLMYVNDAGTFSISGSIRAEYSSYPVHPAPVPRKNETRK